MSTTKWMSGQALTNKLGEIAIFNPSFHLQAACEAAGWRAVDPPVDAPAEKRPRTLAPGWSLAKFSQVGWSCCRPCKTVLKEGAVFYSHPETTAYHCEPCAEAAGAFAPPAPAKTPGCPNEFSWCGQMSDFCHRMAHACYSRTGEPCACSDGCVERHRAARAKPAEPKPAPKYSTGYASACADEAFGPPTTIKKPAPAEKAKREWKAPREMIDGRYDDHAARCVSGDTQADEFGARAVLLAGLERERIPRPQFMRTRYDQETDAHGKLSRLVESGLRADVRQDETRFQAGLRGRR